MQYVLENEHVRVIVDSFAGWIESIYDKKGNHEHFWKYNSEKWPRRTAVCFPICGGLKENSYLYNGRKYQMPMHGFIRENELSVINNDSESISFQFESNEWTREMYPFEFRFVLKYTLRDDGVKIDYLVKNIGTGKMLYSVGSHYTFALPRKQNECEYRFSEVQNARSFTQTNGIISVQENEIFNGGGRLKMDHLFDVASKIYKTEELNTDFISIYANEEKFTEVRYSENFSYIVLWAPKGNNNEFACIEPWAGMADFDYHDMNLENKNGIRFLDSGEEEIFTQEIIVC